MEEMGINYELLGLEETEKGRDLRWLCYMVREDGGEGELKQRVKTWKLERGHQKWKQELGPQPAVKYAKESELHVKNHGLSPRA